MSKGWRLLAQQPVVHGVVPHEVVGAHEGEDAHHLRGLEVAPLGHAPLEPLHRGAVREGPEPARPGEVDEGVEQRRRRDAVLAGRLQVGQQRGGQRAAEAEPHDARPLGPGDVPDDVEGRDRPAQQVVVEADVAVGGVRVAVADGEDRVAVLHRPLHEAAPRRQVHDVVLVDPGRAHQQRRRVDRLGARGVLDQLHQVVAEDDLPRRDRELPAHREGVRVELARHALVVGDVVHERAAARAPRSPRRCRTPASRRRGWSRTRWSAPGHPSRCRRGSPSARPSPRPPRRRRARPPPGAPRAGRPGASRRRPGSPPTPDRGSGGRAGSAGPARAPRRRATARRPPPTPPPGPWRTGSRPAPCPRGWPWRRWRCASRPRRIRAGRAPRAGPCDRRWGSWVPSGSCRDAGRRAPRHMLRPPLME